MGAGLFFLVVGPSGVGKDTLIEGFRSDAAASRGFVFARRVITRAAGSPGEVHEAVDEAEFLRREAAGAFLLNWQAHGLRYGLPMELLSELQAGRHVVANGSRAMIQELMGKVPALVVVDVQAPPEVLSARIEERARENEAQRQQRLARVVPAPPEGVMVVTVENAGRLEEGQSRFNETLLSFRTRMTVCAVPWESAEPVVFLGIEDTATPGRGTAAAEIILGGQQGGGRHKARRMQALDAQALRPDEVGLPPGLMVRWGLKEGDGVVLRDIPPPREREALQRKVRGESLQEAQYRRLLREVVEGRFDEQELAAFLVAVTHRLDDEEVLSVARARASLARQIQWDEEIVVDKHSLGGVPGSRISLIVVPIVAAHGLAIPKTSSRAITSAAGTADVMEILARVDLGREDVRRCVQTARACICWNGRLSHSVLDDVMNAMTRPLGLDASRWSVASILSKKKAAGSTHVIIDVPWGPKTKQPSEEAAQRLAMLFETVGQGLGLQVRALVTDGRQPIGSGIGPALEMRDVMRVLGNHADAPDDLRRKALFFAGHILAWDPRLGNLERGLARAEELLCSGAARQALHNIAQAQGSQAEILEPGACHQEVCAPWAGRIVDIDGWKISGIARAAGAPRDKAAGVDLLCQIGRQVQAGEPLYRIHASSLQGLSEGLAMATPDRRDQTAVRVEPEMA